MEWPFAQGTNSESLEFQTEASEPRLTTSRSNLLPLVNE